MPTGNAPHHRGDYPRRAATLRAWANAHPDATCRRCGRTLAEHPNTKTGKPPTWTAGHLNDGEIGGALAPEVLSCNASAGAKAGNAKRGRRRTPLTW